MGMEQTVTFPAGPVPAWPTVGDLLARSGFAVQMRMIDSELAFPDELPPAAWRELRLGTLGGMVTVRKSANAVALVTWGNADAALLQAWNALTWAFAEAGRGQVQTDAGPRDADAYRAAADLPPALRPRVQ